MESAAEGPHKGQPQSRETRGNTPTAKRTRVLLSCHTCRVSKLKCDRAQPCGQCLRKGRADRCYYAPKPEKQKQPAAESMAARLRRLESMVRKVMDDEGGGQAPAAAGPDQTPGEGLDVKGQVVKVDRSTTYVGATHFMAILEDIEDLKAYFDEPDVPEVESPRDAEVFDAPELLIFSKAVPRNREELLMMLPERSVCDRLIMRYFMSNSPSQHIVHRPTFNKDYNEFWKDPSNAPMHWIALLFMIIAMGTFFSSYLAPHEVTADSPGSAMDRFRQYRTAAGWALVWGKYTQPTALTVQPFLLYVEAEFLLSRAAQMTCYLLSSVCIRIMLKMGLHRDPSKLANIAPFDGEMRRRMWNLAIQIDLLVSFHMGLPSMIHGIETDTALPRNLLDEDFDSSCTELPAGRPMSDYTPMTYAICKATLCRVFGLVARQAHLLTAPPHAEVMRLDALLNEKWAEVPAFMHVQPLEQSVTLPPSQIIQRFGLASLYHKTRCVLHRRYLTEAVPRREHEYSRRTCIDAALKLLEYQNTIYLACQPGGILAANGWFGSSLAVHDFLLAAMIVYIVVQSDTYHCFDGEYGSPGQVAHKPSKEELLQVLRRSFDIWTRISQDAPELKKTADVVATMLHKVKSPASTAETGPTCSDYRHPSPSRTADVVDSGPLSKLALDDVASMTAAMGSVGSTSQGQTPLFDQMLLDPRLVVPERLMPTADDSMWMTTDDGIDWRYFDNMISRSTNEDVGFAGLDPAQLPQPYNFDPFLGSGEQWQVGDSGPAER